jgi:hypothetical protein
MCDITLHLVEVLVYVSKKTNTLTDCLSSRLCNHDAAGAVDVGQQQQAVVAVHPIVDVVAKDVQTVVDSLLRWWHPAVWLVWRNAPALVAVMVRRTMVTKIPFPFQQRQRQLLLDQIVWSIWKIPLVPKRLVPVIPFHWLLLPIPIE